MIIKSSFRRAGGLEAHLLRNDTNEAVRVRTDLFRGATELRSALRLMDGISRSNPACSRSFVHVVVAPGRPLDDDGLAVALGMVESEFGIAADAPRAVVQHAKGERADHFHAVYSIVDLETGRAIDSHGNYAKDELIGRRLELRLGEPVVPGPRLAATIAELERRGLADEVAALPTRATTRDGDALAGRDRQQAARLGIDAAGLSAEVFQLFEGAGRDHALFRRRLAEAGFSVAQGAKALIVLHNATGFETSLVRCLRREAKAAGRPLAIKEADLKQFYSGAGKGAGKKDDVRDAGLARARIGAARALDGEWQRAIFEATADVDVAALDAFRARRKAAREDEERREREQTTATIRRRRQEIEDLTRREEEVRRLRVDRAFRLAAVLDHPALRRLAFALATGGVLMTGGSLTLALVGAGSLVSALPTWQRARRLAAAARGERIGAQAARRAAIADAYRETKRPPRAARCFSFDEVARKDRVLAGCYAHMLIHTGGDRADERLATIRTALGPDLIAGLDKLVERGSPLQLRRLLHWHGGIADDRRPAAIAAALDRHRQTSATATSMATPPPKNKVGCTSARRGRGSGKSAVPRRRPEIER